MVACYTRPADTQPKRCLFLLASELLETRVLADAIPHRIEPEFLNGDAERRLQRVGEKRERGANYLIPLAQTVGKCGLSFSRDDTLTSILSQPFYASNWCSSTSLKPNQVTA